MLFKENYDILSPDFIEKNKNNPMASEGKKEDILKLHEGYVGEMKNSFSSALGKDRLYMRPAGFIMENHLWLLGVLRKYFVSQVLHFSH
jgi:hypothetical protein